MDGPSLFLQMELAGKNYSCNSKNYSDYFSENEVPFIWSKVQHVLNWACPEQLCGHSEEAGGSYSQNTEGNACVRCCGLLIRMGGVEVFPKMCLPRKTSSVGCL